MEGSAPRAGFVGPYIVARENIGESAGRIAGAALLVDYVLTVAVRIAAGVARRCSSPTPS